MSKNNDCIRGSQKYSMDVKSSHKYLRDVKKSEKFFIKNPVIFKSQKNSLVFESFYSFISSRKAFLNLSRCNLETARAWRIKEAAAMLWGYVYMKVAEEAWEKLLRWISLCRIPEMIKVGKTVRNYFWGILNAIRLRATNGILEAKNSCIKRIKRMAGGFRNRERFRAAILFHLGNLNMELSTI